MRVKTTSKSGVARLLAVTVALGFTSSSALAYTAVLYGVEIVVEGKSRSGYVALAYRRQIDPSKPDFLAQMKKFNEFTFIANAVKLPFLTDRRFPGWEDPGGVIVSTAAGMESIPSGLLTEIRRVPRELDGNEVVGNLRRLPDEQARLLQTKRPVYSCSAQYAESPMIYWVSYNPKVGEAALLPICESEIPPKEKRETGLLAQKGVFQVRLSSE